MTASGLLVEPAYRSQPPSAGTLGGEVADLAALAGYAPDLEQRLALDLIFAIRPDGRSAATEVAIICARQNIKTSTFKMAALGWLFVTDQRLIVWSAHEFGTAQEAHRDLAELIEGTPSLRRRLKAVHHGAADKSIETTSGQRVVFKARTSTGGRGLSGDKVVLDEAFALQPAHMGALRPTLSARPDPQLLYGSSAGLEQSQVLRDLRDRGRTGDGPRLGYLEWTDDRPGDCKTPSCDHTVGRAGCRLDDEARWARANPSLGRRISYDYVRDERRGMPPAEFARERLGWWDDPALTVTGVFAEGLWESRRDPASKLEPAIAVYAVEVAEDRSWGCVAAAGPAEGGLHVEVGDYRPGTGWLPARLADLARRYRTRPVRRAAVVPGREPAPRTTRPA